MAAAERRRARPPRRRRAARPGRAAPGRRGLPRWESFPPQDRRLLVQLLLQTARRQVPGRAGGAARRGGGTEMTTIAAPPSTAGAARCAASRAGSCAPDPKVTARHLARQAVVYVRQSSATQVQRHPESARRQYALTERAQRLGWAAEQVEVIDEDQGKSGAGRAAAHERAGFARLASAVGLGGGGARAGPGGLAPGAQLRRVVPPARAGHPVGRPHRRRGRGLRPAPVQRPAAAGPAGHGERGGAALPPGAPAGGAAEQGAPGRAGPAPAGRLRARARRPGRAGPRPGGPGGAPRRSSRSSSAWGRRRGCCASSAPTGCGCPGARSAGPPTASSSGPSRPTRRSTWC